jgi:hypothetical protein
VILEVSFGDPGSKSGLGWIAAVSGESSACSLLMVLHGVLYLHISFDAWTGAPVGFGAMSVTEKTTAIEPRPASIDHSSIIRAEANLLRLPLFALTTKGLRNLDGIECSGRIHRGGQTIQFRYSASRNTATYYPGPLARNAHLAFLSMLTERGLPASEPLTWTWSDLCRRMNVSTSGPIIQKLKQSIAATAGLLIRSESAIYSKPDGKPIETREEALHLYERVVFAGSTMPDGRVADANYLWLSDWYRANLDAFFTAPLDYSLWKHLEQKSAIASRMYEFLLLNFHGTDELRINYETLVKYLPLKSEVYLSQAKQQLGGALDLLAENGLVRLVGWEPSQSGLALLHLGKGERFAKLPAVSPIAIPERFEAGEAVEVKEIRGQHPPEWHLVSDFYREWTKQAFARPTSKELALARELITEMGATRATAVVRACIKLLRDKWPDAKAFAAITKYLPEAINESRKADEKKAIDKAEAARESVESERRSEDAKQLAASRILWEALTEEKRESIRQRVRQHQPKSLEAKQPDLFERFCLREFAGRSVMPPRGNQS